MGSGTADDLGCDVLLFIATSSEDKALRQSAKELGIQCDGMTVPPLGRFYNLGSVGVTRVNAVKTEMGPFGAGGSAARAVVARRITGASAIVQLGMAFGVRPDLQRPGDVLVSTSILAYDYRIVRDTANGGYESDYSQVPRFDAKPSLVDLFGRSARDQSWPFNVWSGAMLSGGARIQSGRFRDELVRHLSDRAGAPIVGGEMEGIGLPAASAATDEPVWAVVKGISDFADADRGAVIETVRPRACRNAADFVLRTFAGAVS